jgi:hypothetical protein
MRPGRQGGRRRRPVDRALELAVSANTVYQAVTFEQICQAGEDATYWEMRGIVARFLRELPGCLPDRLASGG